MGFENSIPVWDRLTPQQQRLLRESAVSRFFPKGELVHEGGLECTGLLIVESGQLRAFILSPEGQEISIYRLLEGDVCLLSASCMLRSIRFDISIEAEKDSRLWIIPAELYRRLMEESPPLANFTNELMADRFSEVMWLMEQILWHSMDRRLAEYLLDRTALEGGSTLALTHEQIARDLGTAREVVTRMLRYFKNEGLVRLARGTVELTDPDGLSALTEQR